MTQKQYLYTAEITVSVTVDSPKPMDSVKLSRVLDVDVDADDDVRLTVRNSSCTNIQLTGTRTITKRDDQ